MQYVIMIGTVLCSPSVSDEVSSKQRVVLVCDGLDTVSTVRINGKVVGTSSNMFHRYIFDIKDAIKPGTNRVQVNFTSALAYSKMKFDEYSYDVPPDCTVPVQHGECHANFIRKEQCSFSWVSAVPGGQGVGCPTEYWREGHMDQKPHLSQGLTN